MRQRQINVRLSDEEHEALKTAAEAEGTTIAAFVRAAALDAVASLDTGTEPGFPAWLLFLMSVLHPSRKRDAGSAG